MPRPNSVACFHDGMPIGVGWASRGHSSRWEADIAIPKESQDAGIAPDEDDDQGATILASHNRHMQQRNADISQFKQEARELYKARKGSREYCMFYWAITMRVQETCHCGLLQFHVSQHRFGQGRWGQAGGPAQT